MQKEMHMSKVSRCQISYAKQSWMGEQIWIEVLICEVQVLGLSGNSFFSLSFPFSKSEAVYP